VLRHYSCLSNDLRHGRSTFVWCWFVLLVDIVTLRTPNAAGFSSGWFFELSRGSYPYTRPEAATHTHTIVLLGCGWFEPATFLCLGAPSALPDLPPHTYTCIPVGDSIPLEPVHSWYPVYLCSLLLYWYAFPVEALMIPTFLAVLVGGCARTLERTFAAYAAALGRTFAHARTLRTPAACYRVRRTRCRTPRGTRAHAYAHCATRAAPGYTLPALPAHLI
jgi:hypothetical protein